MPYILKTTLEGLIYIKASKVINIKRPNTINGVKVFGKPLIINGSSISFLSYDLEGKVTFFMLNGFEISLNITFDNAEEIFSCAKANVEKIITLE